MTERPGPLSDLDRPPERERAFGERALDIWTELLERLPDLPASRRLPEADVHAVAIEVPVGPLPEEEVGPDSMRSCDR